MSYSMLSKHDASGGGSVVWWSVGSGILAAAVAILVTMMVMFFVLKPDVDKAQDRLDVTITDVNTQNTRHLKKDVDQDAELATLAKAISAAEAKLSVPVVEVTTTPATTTPTTAPAATADAAAANALLTAVLAELMKV